MASFEEVHAGVTSDFMCLVPATGFGTRLWDLTAERAKPGVAVAFDSSSNEIRRMIDVPLDAIRGVGGAAIVSTHFQAQTLGFLSGRSDVYRVQYSASDYSRMYSQMDTLASVAGLLRKADVGTVGLVPCDTFITAAQLAEFREAFDASGADAAILSTRVLDGHNVRAINENGIMCGEDEAADHIADLGVHLFRSEWLLRRLDELADRPYIDIWDDLYRVPSPAGRVLLHVLKEDPGWVDMGTVSGFRKAVMFLNKEHVDRWGNVVFPGAAISPGTVNTIALPNSSSNSILKHAIVAEDKVPLVFSKRGMDSNGMVQPWETISSETVFTHPKMDLVKDVVRLPDGNEMEYIRMGEARNHSVAVIAVNGLLQILVQREYSHPPGEVMWQLPGGSIEQGESVAQAAQRELSAESGYVGGQVQEIGWFYTNNRLSDQRQHVVVVSDLREGRSTADMGEFIENTWMYPYEIATLIREGKIRNMNMAAALALYNEISSHDE